MRERAAGISKLGGAVLAAWAGLVLLFLTVSVQKIWAGDFWGQLRAGQWIVENENGRMPRFPGAEPTKLGLRTPRWSMFAG